MNVLQPPDVLVPNPVGPGPTRQQDSQVRASRPLTARGAELPKSSGDVRTKRKPARRHANDTQRHPSSMACAASLFWRHGIPHSAYDGCLAGPTVNSLIVVSSG